MLSGRRMFTLGPAFFPISRRLQSNSAPPSQSLSVSPHQSGCSDLPGAVNSAWNQRPETNTIASAAKPQARHAITGGSGGWVS